MPAARAARSLKRMNRASSLRKLESAMNCCLPSMPATSLGKTRQYITACYIGVQTKTSRRRVTGGRRWLWVRHRLFEHLLPPRVAGDDAKFEQPVTVAPHQIIPLRTLFNKYRRSFDGRRIDAGPKRLRGRRIACLLYTS